MTAHTVFYTLGVIGPGGQERQILTIVRNLDPTRWKVVVVGTEAGALCDDFARYADVHVLRDSGPVHTGRLGQMRRLLDKYQPSIVHTSLFTGNTWGRLGVALRPINRPLVIMQEGSIDSWKGIAHRVVDRLLLGVTDAVVGNSQAVSRYLIEHERVPPHLVRTIPNGIALERAQQALGEPTEERRARRAELGIGDEHFVIGHVGRFDPVKGLDVLLDAFTHVHRQLPNARLLRVAQPPIRPEIPIAAAWDQTVRDRGLEGAIVNHPYTRNISAVYNICDAVVQTSWREGLSNVILEAMAMERSVVATAVGGTPEVVHHRRTGWIAPPGDVNGLASGLLHAYHNPIEARQWGIAGRKLVESEYTVERLVERTVSLYETMLNRPR